MALGTGLATTSRDLSLRWSRSVPLTWRILAVNIFVIAMLVGGFLYLDSYRTRLVAEREQRLSHEVMLLDAALDAAKPDAARQIVRQFADVTNARVRLYSPDGRLAADSFAMGPPAYVLRDPAMQDWSQRAARAIDRALDWVVAADIPRSFAEPATTDADAWPELVLARTLGGQPAIAYRFAPDRTPMISAAMVNPRGGAGLLLLTNARDITETVRAERLQLAFVLAAVTLVSVLLSLFLARTIVQPLRRLAGAATRVRLGRAREVVVPRLPSRRDEIGTLARALSDMTQALRLRIDAGEHFAADVTHELKNPLASLRSAIEGMDRLGDGALRDQLLAIAADDVRRLDRLITDISEVSRVDAELSRARFTRINLRSLIDPIIAAHTMRAKTGDPRVMLDLGAGADAADPSATILGVPTRLMRVVENLIDNAHSFSPPDGLIRVTLLQDSSGVLVRVEDDGPGVPAGQRDVIFRRFHSVRPESEDFGRHSGLGLTIARSIIEAHDGRICATDRPDGQPGACFEIRLPLAPEAEP